MKKNKKKIIIFGSSSFIGYSISYYLSKNTKNIDITNIVSKHLSKYSGIKKKRLQRLNKNKFLKLNILNEPFQKLEKIIKIEPDIIINCLGDTQNFNNRNYKLLKNKKIFLNFFDLINKLSFQSKKKIKLIHIGSGHEYGIRKTKFAELDFCKPITNYGKLKLFEKNYLENNKIAKINVIILRVFSIFGELMKKNNIINDLVKAKSTKIEIRKPNQFIDIIHIKYLLLLIKKILNQKEKRAFEIINVSSSHSIKIFDIIYYLKKKKLLLKVKYLTSNKKFFPTAGNNNKLLSIIKIKNINVLNDIYKFFLKAYSK